MDQTEDQGSYDQDNNPIISEMQGDIRGLKAHIGNLQVQIEGMFNSIQNSIQEQISAAFNNQFTPNTANQNQERNSPLREAFNSSSIKEISKRIYSFPEANRLEGPSNFDQWKETLAIQFRAFGLSEFITNPAISRGLSDADQAIVLMLIRDSCEKVPQAAIMWTKTPEEAYKLLLQQFSYSADLQRGSLYAAFHNLNFKGYRGSLETFNAEFNSLLARLQQLGALIAPIDQVNQYLNATKEVFSQWAERQRNNIRNNKALGQGPTLSLPYIIADLLEEQRDKSSSVSKAMSYRIKNDNKATEVGKKPDELPTKAKAATKAKKGLKKTDKTQKRTKQQEKEHQAPGNPKNASFLIGNYTLESEDDTSDASDSGIEDIQYIPSRKGSTYSVREAATFKNALLYDTGSTAHLINNKAFFTTFTPYKKGQLGTIITGGGPIYPKGKGTAEFIVVINENPIKYRTLILKEALYTPELDTNLVSGIRHYAAGGTLIKQRLFCADFTCCGLFEFKKHGFFFQVKGKDTPMFIKPSTRFSYLFSYPIEVQIPTNSSLNKEDYKELSETESEFDQTPTLEENIPLEGEDTENQQSLNPLQDPIEENIPLKDPTPNRTIDISISKGPNSYKKLLDLAGLWHIRLGHIGLPLLKKTATYSNEIPNFDAIKESDFFCLACYRSKAVRRVSKKAIKDPPKALDLIEGDTFKISPIPYNKRPVGLLLIDRKTRFRWVFLLSNKEGETIFQAIKGFYKSLKGYYNIVPKAFHFDGGKEVNGLLQAYFTSKGTIFSTSSPYQHEQNGLAERSIRVALDRLRATLQWAKLPLYLWSAVLPYIIGIINTTAVSNRDKTPYELLREDLGPQNTRSPYKPNYKALRAIGAYCEVLIPPEKRSKLNKLALRTEPARLLATLGSNTYLIYIPSRRTVTKTSHLKVIEGVGPMSEGLEPIGLTKSYNQDTEELQPNLRYDHSDPDYKVSEELSLQPSNNSDPDELSLQPSNESYIPKRIADILQEASQRDITISQPTLEPMDLDSEEISYLIWDLCYKAKQKAANSITPTTFKEAIRSPERALWKNAIFNEFRQLLLARTFLFIPKKDLLKGRKVLSNRLVLKVKKDQLNKPIKYKARLVAKGFMQVEGLDFTETFASTSIPPTWRVLLAIAAIRDLEVEQIDFIGAFLNSSLSETIYMAIPEGLHEFIEQERPINNSLAATLAETGYNPAIEQVIQLKKGLYGLKQSPREWQKTLLRLLKSLGFLPLISDPSVTYNRSHQTYIVTYVDDCLIIGPQKAYINRLKRLLNKGYPLDDRGPASLFLGVQITRNRSQRKLFLDQGHYITEVLSVFQAANIKPRLIPLQPGLIRDTDTKDVLEPIKHKRYQQLIGALIWLSTQTRPDIAFAVNWLSRALQAPTIAHLTAAIGLLGYLKGTKDLAISYKGIPEPLKLTQPLGYSDSDFSGDRTTSKSTYGYLYLMANGPVSWKSKRSSTIALSTLEAESDALLEAIREAKWITNLLKEVNIPFKEPISLYCDNQGSIGNANNPTLHARTKHTLLKFHYIREEVKNNLIEVTYIPTTNMVADGLTKPLASPKQQAFLKLLGLKPSI